MCLNVFFGIPCICNFVACVNLNFVLSFFFIVGAHFHRFLFTHAYLTLRITIINIRTESLPWNVNVSVAQWLSPSRLSLSSTSLDFLSKRCALKKLKLKIPLFQYFDSDLAALR